MRVCIQMTSERWNKLPQKFVIISPQCPVWEMSAVALTLAWINLLIYMRQIPILGKYITIFHDILYTFLKVTVTIVIFVIAFALGFHVLLVYQKPFESVQYSLLKVAIMMSGEFDYMDIFLDEDGPPLPFATVTYLLFVVFFVLVSVITLNLLIGLTVNDIKIFLDEADLKNLQLKITYVLGIEKTFNKRFFEKFFTNARIQKLR